MSTRTLVYKIFKVLDSNIPTWRIIDVPPPDDSQIKNVKTETKSQKAIPNLKERINHLKKVFTVNTTKMPAKPKTLSKKSEVQNRILKKLRKFKKKVYYLSKYKHAQHKLF